MARRAHLETLQFPLDAEQQIAGEIVPLLIGARARKCSRAGDFLCVSSRNSRRNRVSSFFRVGQAFQFLGVDDGSQPLGPVQGVQHSLTISRSEFTRA